MIKAQFMQQWDGLATRPDCTVIVLGATNRPKDVDRAILRRMPATFQIGLPDAGQRKHILRLILRIEDVADDVDYNRLAGLTDGYSGSDLRELCRTASVYRVREMAHDHDELRSIAMADLLAALAKMRESKVHCGTSVLNQYNLD